jgi:hypothetical protein
MYTSSVLRGAPYAFYKISFTYKKKKSYNSAAPKKVNALANLSER